MSLLAAIRRLWYSIAPRTQSDVEEEFRSTLDAYQKDLIRQGLPEEEARRKARIDLGQPTAQNETYRDAIGLRFFDEFGGDIRYGLRALRRSPGFTAVAVLTLALGIGLNTAIFSLIDAVMLRKLPVERPDELFQVQVGNTDESGGRSEGESPVSTAIWEQLRDQPNVFSGVFAWARTSFEPGEVGTTRALDGTWVSGSFFNVLGLRPAAGRLIADSDDRRGCPAVAVLSYGFWQDHYGGAKTAIGSTLSLSGYPFEVIGVAPRHFFGMEVGRRFDVTAPICAKAIIEGKELRWGNVQVYWLNVGGRVNPKASRAQLAAQLRVLSTSLFVPPNASPAEREALMKIFLRIVPAGTGISSLRGKFTHALEVLMAVVGMVLLIACANLASLTLARGAARHREIAMRRALGASRARLIRQLLTECVLLSSAGALLGVFLARWAAALLVRLISTAKSTPSLDLSPGALLPMFVLATVALNSLLMGLLPALHATRLSLNSVIKGTQSSEAGRYLGFRGRHWIVGSQVALSLVLVVAAGLLLRSFVKLVTLDVGFDRNNVLVMRTSLRTANVPLDRRLGAYAEIESRLKALPGVLSVGLGNEPIMGACAQFGKVQSQWHELDTAVSLANFEDVVCGNFISAGYLPTLRIRLLAGRNFSSADLETASNVAIINQTFSRRFFPDLNPIGKTFRIWGMPGEKAFYVVGLIEDFKLVSLREKSHAVAFFPFNELPTVLLDTPKKLELRTAVPPSALIPQVRAAIAGFNRAIPVQFSTLAEQIDDSLVNERLLASLSGLFGALALLLAMIGLYGTLSYLVTQRQREFGVRMALGAAPGSILGLVMRDLLVILVGSLAAGILISLAATRVLQKMLFGLSPRDTTTMLLGAGVLTAVGLVAGYLPARRATKVDPMVALRDE